MRLEERRYDGAGFSRRKATADTIRKVADWEVWECRDTAFRHSYDRTVTLYVQEGSATLTFGSGDTVKILTGDTLTIEAGCAADWVIRPPIRNLFRYHDTFDSAAHRQAQIHWRQG